MELRVKGDELKMEGFKEFLVDAYGFKDLSGISLEVVVKTYNKEILPLEEPGSNFFDVVEDAERIHNLIDNYINLKEEDLSLNEMLDEAYSNYVQIHTEQQEALLKIFTNYDTPPDYKYVLGLDNCSDEGLKESDDKVPMEELDWDYVDSMAYRMQENDKYPTENWKKKMDVKKLAASAMRHARAILQPSEYDTESQQDHAVALGCNGMMINYQLK